MKDLYGPMSRDRDQFHPGYNEYMKGIDIFLEEPHSNPKNFLGSCCIISQQVDKELTGGEPTMESDSSPLPPSKKHKLIDSVDRSGTCYTSECGGTFCLPEFNLLVGGNDKCIDVFGLGSDCNVPAVWHCFLEEEHCMFVEQSTSKKVSKSLSHTWHSEIVQLSSIDPPEQMLFQNTKRKKNVSALFSFFPRL